MDGSTAGRPNFFERNLSTFLAYAEKLFWLFRTPKKEKVPRIKNYEALADARGIRLDELLNEPPLNFARKDGAKFAQVLAYFQDLSGCRGAGFGGPLALTHQEILAWRTLTKVPLTDLELVVLRELDRVFLEGLYSDGDA